MKAITTTLFSALLLAATACNANEGMTEQVEEASPTFATLDANYDGAISAEEAQKYSDLVSVFDEADANDDGQLSAAEYDNAVSTLLAS